MWQFDPVNVIENRKEQQRVARENLILENAAKFLAREGFQNLNLDELALSVAYSKGTLYLHFRTKEDLIMAVETRALKYRNDLLERASALVGTTRERARAMEIACCQFAVAHPDFFAAELMLQEQSFWERVSPERQNAHLEETQRLVNVVNNLVEEAQRAGDLSRDILANDVTLSVMAMSLGSHCLITRTRIHSLCKPKDPLAALRLNLDRLLDGWGWLPISNGNAHEALDRRIVAEIFPEASWFKASC
jgi:AcrR family transcriptional regulator